MKKMLSILVPIFTIFIIIIGIYWVNVQNKPLVKNGVIDFTGWDFKSNSEVPLTGEWNFYWNQLVKDIPNNKSVPIKVPGVWNGIKYGEESATGFGYGVYQIEVTGVTKGEELAIRMNTVSTAYNLYIDDKLVASNGIVSENAKSSAPYYKPHIIKFAANDSNFKITIEVSNYVYARGGIWYNLEIGSFDKIEEYNVFLIYKDSIIIGSLLILTFFLFMLSIGKKKDRYYFYQMLMSLILIVRTSLYGDYLLIRIFPDITFNLLIFLTYMTFIWFSIVLLLMVLSITHNDEHPLKKMVVVYGIITSTIIAVLPINIFTQWILVLDIIAITFVIIALFFLHREAKMRISYSEPLLVGCMFILAFGIYDGLYQANMVYLPIGELSAIGTMIFMYLNLYIIAMKDAKNYNILKETTLELQKSLESEKILSEKLSQVEQYKEEFLINTSQEIRIPVQMIINASELLLTTSDENFDSKKYKQIQSILTAAKKINTRMNRLLDIILLSKNNHKIDEKTVDLGSIVQNIAVLFNDLVGKRDIKLQYKLLSNCPKIIGDEARIQQIFFNLIRSAIKSMNSGTITIASWIQENRIYVSVSDDGSGMSEEYIRKATHIFEMVNGQLVKINEISSLKLFSAKQLVELHGGVLDIQSVIGKGTIYTFSFKIAYNLNDELPIEENLNNVIDFENLNQLVTDFAIQNCDPEQEWEPNKNYDILVIEDNLLMLNSLTYTLRSSGYNVIGVCTGRKAQVCLAPGNRFQLVILDILLPDISGYQILREIREKFTAIEMPVILLTDRSKHLDLKNGFDLGINDFLTKPIENDELLARVKSLMEMKRAINQSMKNELAFLQAQIKPHFIYNALSVISSITLKNPNQAKELLLDLSDYLRGCFQVTTHNDLTTFSSELDLVKAYVAIEQARFKERLNIIYQIDETLDFTLPILTIQPLVENAIRHGILSKIEGGQIIFRVNKVMEEVQIIIEDNGIGIKQDKINQVLSLVDSGNGVGLGNVNKRLVSLYGKGLEIDSHDNKGTKITIKIPLL